MGAPPSRLLELMNVLKSWAGVGGVGRGGVEVSSKNDPAVWEGHIWHGQEIAPLMELFGG